MRAALWALGFVVFVGGLMFAAWWSATAGSPPAAPVASTRPAAPHPSPPGASPPSASPPSATRRAAPALPALFVYRSDAEPAPIALAGPRQKPALLHLWATWCGPCRAELPELLERGRKGDLEVIAVSVDDYYKNVRLAFSGAPYNGKIPAEIVWDKTITLERALGVGTIPTTFLVDTQGNVRERFDGAQHWLSPELTNQIATALRN